MIFRNFIEFDNIKYEYESGSWRRDRILRSSRNTTQNIPSYQYNGIDKGIHSINLLLNTASTNWGASTSGESQLYSLETTLSKTGLSMPVLFVDPVGRTFSVVPTGVLTEQLSPNSIYGNTTTSIDIMVPLTLNETQ